MLQIVEGHYGIKKTLMLAAWFVDLRGELINTMQVQEFNIPQTTSTSSDQRNPDKAKLREKIFQLRQEGKSFREIAKEVSLHWTRVQQIVKGKSRN